MSAFIYGYVDTDHAGYRKITLGGSTYTVAAGYYRWDAYITAINTAISASGWALVSGTDGVSTLTKASGTAAIAWPDRLGWLLGYEVEPAATEHGTGSLVGRGVAPGAIPLLGATWEDVQITKESQFLVDRSRRGHGYVFGTSRIWRWTLVMTSAALQALRTGWCLNGKIVISAATPAGLGSDPAWTTSATGGHLEGVPVGLEDVTWIDALQTQARVSMLISTAGP